MDPQLAAAVEGAIGTSILGFRGALSKWIDTLVREGGHVDVDAFCARIRKTVGAAEPLASLDIPALLDVVLAPESAAIFGPLVDRDTRALLFDVRRHRNAWAHHRILSLREAYRALDCIEQLLGVLAPKVLVEVERSSTLNALDEVTLAMAARVWAKRTHGDAVELEPDGDVAMLYGED